MPSRGAGFSKRARGGCSTVVPMPADVLSSYYALLTWVRLEARPFLIPPRIALVRLSVFDVEWFVGFQNRCLHRCLAALWL